MNLTFWWSTIYVSDIERSLAFYRDKLGLHVRFADEHYASLRLGQVLIELSKGWGQDRKEGAASQVGSETGIGLGVRDINAAYEQLVSKGVQFRGPPEKQPWGDVLAIMVDPDGNTLVLDQLPPDGLTEAYLNGA